VTDDIGLRAAAPALLTGSVEVHFTPQQEAQNAGGGVTGKGSGGSCGQRIDMGAKLRGLP
jgi:hypothetical protein